MTEKDYFHGITTLRGAERRWKALAKKHHPDIRGGDGKVMAIISEQYYALRVRLQEPVVKETENVPYEHIPVPPIPEPPMPEARPTAGFMSSIMQGIRNLDDSEKREVVDVVSDAVKVLAGIGMKKLLGTK